MQMEFSEIKKLIKTDADAMIEKYTSLKELKDIPVPTVYHFADNTKNTLAELQSKFDKNWKKVIYIFSTKTPPALCLNIERAQTKFEEINSRNKCMPRINEEHWNRSEQKPCYMYVGSCKAKPNERMRDHLCNPANTTYALHLKEWWTGDEKFNLDVFVFGETLPPEDLQIIEDLIWGTCKPLFGKKGHK
jgi:hypothetical protein